MNVQNKIRMENTIHRNVCELEELIKSYKLLEGDYQVTLLFGGLLVLFHIHNLGWASGIAWLFLSRFIAVLLVRIDFNQCLSTIMKEVQNNTMPISNLLN